MNSSGAEATSGELLETEERVENTADQVDAVAGRISSTTFDQWYREREYQQNIREGTHYFNGPGKIRTPERHSPSSLLQCHRKTSYKQLNAAEETGDPTGIFWVGSRFEEDVVVPYLQGEVVGDGEYVTNSLWVDYTVDTDSGELRIKGETDPVIVTSEAEPILLTEIKTKRSVENVEKPNPHHKAQAHAYLKGLSEKYDRTVSDAIILYGSRTSFDIEVFRIEFDPYYWRKTVLNWAANHTEYRLNDELPPADPEYNWECKFCSFRERCGEGELKFEDIGSEGLLPGFTGYPKEKIKEYLQAHDWAKLTPSLAHRYPVLAEKYGAFDWKCRGCSRSVPWDNVEWDGDSASPPSCPTCAGGDPVSVLAGPAPAAQRRGEEHDNR